MALRELLSSLETEARHQEAAQKELANLNEALQADLTVAKQGHAESLHQVKFFQCELLSLDEALKKCKVGMICACLHAAC